METRKCKLKSLSELLEGYSRRDNVRIIGLKEVKRTGDNGQTIFEDYNQSVEVLSVASAMGALVEKSDVSIAHRLPGRNLNARPMIARF